MLQNNNYNDNDYIKLQPEVKKAIESHIYSAISSAKSRKHHFTSEEKLTGAIFSLLIKDETKIEINIDGKIEIWTYSIIFKETRGNCKNAPETTLGTDGIIELIVNENGREKKKSLLVQAKMDWKTKNSELYLQCFKMVPFFGSAIVVNYTDEGFETFGADDVFFNQGRKPEEKKQFEDILANDFLDCKIGAVGMYYEFDFQKRNTKGKRNDNGRLYYPDSNDKKVFIDFNTKDKLEINIKKEENYKKITTEEAYCHRLRNDLDSLERSRVEETEAKELRKEIYKIYSLQNHKFLQENQKKLLEKMLEDYEIKFYQNRFNDLSPDFHSYSIKNKDELNRRKEKFDEIFKESDYQWFSESGKNVIAEMKRKFDEQYELKKSKLEIEPMKSGLYEFKQFYENFQSLFSKASLPLEQKNIFEKVAEIMPDRIDSIQNRKELIKIKREVLASIHPDKYKTSSEKEICEELSKKFNSLFSK
ncbi:MAG: hypothetical protein FWG84_05560 [Bacteroidales bacterium]|nr:hypothetical protein [Bacteroidales bacterium]